MSDCYRARDQRSALYLKHPKLFLKRLQAEAALHEVEAHRLRLVSAIRPNGGSDLAWEQLHPKLFEYASDTQFFDYTKIPARMHRFLKGDNWPTNYHLTFSAGDDNHDEAKRILNAGGNVAIVFWPTLPKCWWDYPVLNGDQHDARFLDQPGSIVGLLAKGVARVDLGGFVIRPCPECDHQDRELHLLATHQDTHRHTLHKCSHCGYQLRARWIITPTRKPAPLVPPSTTTTRQFPLTLGTTALPTKACS